MTDELLTLLTRIAEDVHAIRDDLHAMRRGRAADALLPLIALHVGSSVFSCHELVEYARLDAAQDLRDAIEQTCGAVNARKLGRLFARIEGQPVAGWRVVHVDKDSSGIIWSLESF